MEPGGLASQPGRLAALGCMWSRAVAAPFTNLPAVGQLPDERKAGGSELPVSGSLSGWSCRMRRFQCPWSPGFSGNVPV